MRTLSARDTELLTIGRATARARVYVHDGTSYVNVSDLDGKDYVEAVEFGASVDEPVMTADITLRRDSHRLSLSPLMEASALNRDFDPANAFDPLAVPARRVKVEAAFVPRGHEPAAADWLNVFEGYIDDVDFGSSGLKLACSDLGARLRDTFIERERVYGFTGAYSAVQKGLYIWQPAQVYAVDDLSLPAEASFNGFFYRCTVAGTAGATQPTWPTTIGGTVVDGTATWKCEAATSEPGVAVEGVIQRILNDNLGSAAPTLYTPTSPGWMIRKFKQQREPLFEAVRTLALQIGWDSRYLWRASTSQWEFTFFEPERSKTTPDHTFGPDDVLNVSQLSQGVAGVRNVCRVWYYDSADLDGNKKPKRKFVEASDAASIAKPWGRRYMEIGEDESSLIDTSAEATSMAQAAVSDLATPLADQAVEVPLFLWAELGDLYRFSANGIHYDADQDLAVVAYRQNLMGSQLRTSLTTRGKPAGAYREWLKRIPTKANPTHQAQGFDGTMVPSSSGVVGGGRVRITVGDRPNTSVFSASELHLSESASFIPNDSTLVSVTPGADFELGDLTPGQTYYARVVPFGFNESRIVRGQPSEEFSFVAGYLEPRHINPAAGLVPGPVNGGFEDIDASNVPFRWTVTAGGWERGFAIEQGSLAGEGSNSLKFTNAITETSTILSDQFPARTNAAGVARVALRARAEIDGASQFTATLHCYNAAGTLVGSEPFSWSMADLSTTWSTKVFDTNAIDATAARFAVELTNNGNSIVFWVDAIRVDAAPDELAAGSVTAAQLAAVEAWHEVGASGEPAFQNSWANYGAGYPTAAYRVDRDGVVHLKGMVKSGTVAAGAANGFIFTLPAAYRPSVDFAFPVVSNGAFGSCWIRASGGVDAESGSNVWFSLAGISFKL